MINTKTRASKQSKSHRQNGCDNVNKRCVNKPQKIKSIKGGKCPQIKCPIMGGLSPQSSTKMEDAPMNRKRHSGRRMDTLMDLLAAPTVR